MMWLLPFLLMSAEAKNMKALERAMHGDRMTVSYVRTNADRHLLIVGDLREDRTMQTLDLGLRKGEHFAEHKGFLCVRGTEPVYAVISEKRARPKGGFTPERAWDVDQQNFKLVGADHSQVVCQWRPDGSDSRYPFRAYTTSSLPRRQSSVE